MKILFPLPSIMFAASLLSTAVHADETARVSLTSTDGEGNDDSGTGPVHAVAISGDGTRVAFVAHATNLVPGDTNGKMDVFVRDITAGTTVRASVSTAGVQGNDDSYLPRISSQGRYVIFQSFSSTLVPNDTNGWSDVFVRDLTTGTTARESVSSSEVQGNLNSESGSISGDGRYLAFWSNASNLVASDTNGTGDIFLRDRLLTTTARVSLGAGGVQSNGNSGDVSISADGAELAFTSSATNLVPGDTNGVQDVFLRDLSSGAMSRAGTGGGHPQPNGASDRPTLSADGRYVALESSATNLVAGDTNGQTDVFVQDRQTFDIERVSVDSGGGQANDRSFNAWISENGRYVTFESEATDLVTGDTNGAQDVFVHDRQANQTRRVSVSSSGVQGSSLSFYPAPSADGAEIAFGSHSTNLVPGDTNADSDVFLRSDTLEPLPYCFGVTTCPCFNPGGGKEGCANSTGSGAALGWSGSSSASADDLVLEAHGLLPNQPALAFVGLTLVNNGTGAPFGDGLRCAANGVVRLGVETPDAQGDASYGPGLGATGGWIAGDIRYFQVWYRDPVGGPCGSGFNLTNGLQVLFGS